LSKSITQKLKYRESVIKFSEKYGVYKAAIKFGEHPKTIYRWKSRYYGSLKSLEPKSRNPHHHPNEHTEDLLFVPKKKALVWINIVFIFYRELNFMGGILWKILF